MSEAYTDFNNILTIEINLEQPFFHRLCANDQVYNFKMPFLTEEEIHSGKCDRIQSVKELESFIREVKTVDEQESLLYELIKRIKALPNLSSVRNMIIRIQNKKRDGSIYNQTLDYNFMTHELALSV